MFQSRVETLIGKCFRSHEILVARAVGLGHNVNGDADLAKRPRQKIADLPSGDGTGLSMANPDNHHFFGTAKFRSADPEQ